MTTTATAALAQATEQRTQKAHDRALRALRELNEAGRAISFAAVAKQAMVSRGFLYKTPALRAEIEKLRTVTAGIDSVPASERVSEESLRSRLRAALDENTRLRGEISQMREELAIAHGRVRELQVTSSMASRPQ